MTPNHRLDQLEPLMADSLQKIDRLIEGQGQILEIATRAEQKADTTAKGVANLTIRVNDMTDKVNHMGNEISHMGGKVNHMGDEISHMGGKVTHMTDEISHMGDKVNHVANDQVQFRQEVRQEFDQVNQKFDQVNQKFELVNLKFDQVNQKIDTEIGSLRQKMNQRFDQLVTLIQDRLK